MTMNHADAQAFFNDASKSFEQMRAIFRSVATELNSFTWSDAVGRNHKDRILGLVGAGDHISSDMAEVVGYWASEAAEPWLEDASTPPLAKNKIGATHVDTQTVSRGASECFSADALAEQLLEIKVLVESIDRLIWQDGDPGGDENQLTDAMYLTKIATRMLSDLWCRTESFEIKPIRGRGDRGGQNNCLP